MTDTDATSGNSMEPFGSSARQIPEASRPPRLRELLRLRELPELRELLRLRQL